MKKKTKIIFWIAGMLSAAVLGFFIYYVNDYYAPLQEAEMVAEQMKEVDGNLYFYGQTDTGIILYPGGKVDERAYAPLAQRLHESGHTVVIVSMPLHLAIMKSSAADRVIAANPDITSWYIAGHSLGGTAAGMYAESNKEALAGVIFLGSYPYKDLRDYEGLVLTIDASGDEVLNREAAEEKGENYPAHAVYKRIEGGNHAGFGAYGPQNGDGAADITWEEQQDRTAAMILEHIEQ